MTDKNLLKRIVDQINRVIVGKEDVIELLVIALVCEGHVLIEDVPGTGKTTLALALSKSINGEMKRISCTPDVLPSDITGFSMYNPASTNFEYKEGAVMANVFLADEINRTPPKTQSGLLEAMEEGHVTVDGTLHELPKPFMVMATQNPIEHLGTYPLPEAQLDRFFMKIALGYPTVEEEMAIMERFAIENPLNALKPCASLEEVINISKQVLQVTIQKDIQKYIAEIVMESRRDRNISLGISTRGAISLQKAAKAYAYYNGRDYVVPDDIKAVIIPVCAHRLTPRPEANYENITREDILLGILSKVTVPGGDINE